MVNLNFQIQASTKENVFDDAQKHAVSVKHKGKETLVMTPEILEDLIDGLLAKEVKEHDLLSVEETSHLLEKYRNA